MDDDLAVSIAASRARFLAAVADLRPALHRYCARMVGSVADGEDVVQDTLARAYFLLADVDELPPLRPWLFRIAHRKALDVLKRYDVRMGEPLADEPADPGGDSDDALARDEAVRAALSRFMTLPPAQRSCVVLKDVLDESLEDVSALVGLTVPAVKAALHRGRTRLREAPEPGPAAYVPSPVIAKWAALFNARDWDGVRAMLADDVRLDLVNRSARIGRSAVGGYVARYASGLDVVLEPGWCDDREVVFASDGERRYIIVLTTGGDRVVDIRDYRYVPYILADNALR